MRVVRHASPQSLCSPRVALLPGVNLYPSLSLFSALSLSLLACFPVLGACVLAVGLCGGRFLPLWCGRSLLASLPVPCAHVPFLASVAPFFVCLVIVLSFLLPLVALCVLGLFPFFFLSLSSGAVLRFRGPGPLGDQVPTHSIHVRTIHQRDQCL